MANPKIKEFGKSTQFTSDNQPDHSKGRLTFKKQLNEILDGLDYVIFENAVVMKKGKDGRLVQTKDVVTVKVHMPTRLAVSHRLVLTAMKGGQQALRAIEMLMDRTDGRPTQSVSFEEIPVAAKISINTGGDLMKIPRKENELEE